MTVKRSDLAILRQIGKTLKFVSTNGLQWVLVSWSLLLLTISGSALAQDENELAYNPNLSIARNWNEALLFAIRNDFARPTVHARNLFHASAAMYDSWSLYSNSPSLYFLGRTLAPDNTALSACELSDDLRLSLQDSDEAELLAARETTLVTVSTGC